MHFPPEKGIKGIKYCTNLWGIRMNVHHLIWPLHCTVQICYRDINKTWLFCDKSWKPSFVSLWGYKEVVTITEITISGLHCILPTFMMI